MPRKKLPDESEEKRRFLDYYSEGKTSIKAATQAIGIPFSRVYRWKKQDPTFMDELESIEQMFADEVLFQLRLAAASITNKASVTAAIFLTKGKRPEYKDRTNTVKVSGELSLKDKCKGGK